MNAVTGGMSEQAARELLLQAGIRGLQRKAGYVAQTWDGIEHEFAFLLTSTGRVGFSVRECGVFRLSPNWWVELIFPFEETKLRYPNVLVFHEFVVFCWSDAMEINYEWCQLEVSRNALIEMWESKQS